MTEQLRCFYIALTFLTRLKSPLNGSITQQQIGHSMLYYPLVGVLIGLILLALKATILFFSANFSPEVLAALLLTFWVLVSGGLHLDGLADSADAWIGGLNDRDRTLEIMKDPACGPIGVISLFLVLLLKWTALCHLLKADQSAFLVVLPMLSRSAILLLFMTTLYVRDSGLGSALLDCMPKHSQLWMVLSLSAMAYWIFASFLSLLFAVIVLMSLRKMMQARLGGMTGDTIGASVEIVEAAALVALVF